MADVLQYKQDVRIIEGGYPGELKGVIEDIPSGWQTAPQDQEITNEYIYYYHDSLTTSNSNSSRVLVKIKDVWSWHQSGRNAVVTIKSTLESVTRQAYQGSPSGVSFNIKAYEERDGPLKWSASNNAINAYGAITGNPTLPVVLESHTFTLPPAGGQAQGVGSIYYFSAPTQYPSPGWYADAFYMGTNFRNPQEPDYRPGKILKADGQWYSHNRNGGAAKVLKADGTWQEMRTVDGGVGTGNPPLIRYNNTEMKNMRLIGLES